MKYRDQFLLEQAYTRTTLKEAVTDRNITDLIKQFQAEVLSQYIYKDTGKDHLNCAWATQAFCNFCKRNGIPCKAIYFVWPAPETVSKLKQNKILPSHTDDSGESHIAPVVNNMIVDFTIGQFYPNETIKVTPLNKWQSVYGRFGYGTNAFRGRTFFYDTYEALVTTPGLDINPIAPSSR